jgi:hypothetical protein
MAQPSDPKAKPSEPTAAEPDAPATYQPPTLTELGSVRELTQGVTGEQTDNLTVGSGA